MAGKGAAPPWVVKERVPEHFGHPKVVEEEWEAKLQPAGLPLGPQKAVLVLERGIAGVANFGCPDGFTDSPYPLHLVLHVTQSPPRLARRSVLVVVINVDVLR